jgi:hypothetical protein
MGFSYNPQNQSYSTSSGKDVKTTKMLKGEAKDSLHGKNVTKPDMRSGSIPDKGGSPGKPKN